MRYIILYETSILDDVQYEVLINLASDLQLCLLTVINDVELTPLWYALAPISNKRLCALVNLSKAYLVAKSA